MFEYKVGKNYRRAEGLYQKKGGLQKLIGGKEWREREVKKVEGGLNYRS